MFTHIFILLRFQCTLEENVIIILHSLAFRYDYSHTIPAYSNYRAGSWVSIRLERRLQEKYRFPLGVTCP